MKFFLEQRFLNLLSTGFFQQVVNRLLPMTTLLLQPIGLVVIVQWPWLVVDGDDGLYEI